MLERGVTHFSTKPATSVYKTELYLSDQGRNLNDSYLKTATRWCFKSLLQQPPVHTTEQHSQLKQRAEKEQAEGSSRPAAVPLDFHTLCAVHVVAFPVGSIILGVGGRSRFEVLRVLGELHSLGLGPRLVAELDQCHHHGQPQASHKDIEHARDIAQAQSARLVLRETRHAVSSAEGSRHTDRHTDNRLFASGLAGIATLVVFRVWPTDQGCPPIPAARGCSAVTALPSTLRWWDPGSLQGNEEFLATDFPRPLVSQNKVAYGWASQVAKALGESCAGGCIKQQDLQKAMTKPEKEKAKPLHTWVWSM